MIHIQNMFGSDKIYNFRRNLKSALWEKMSIVTVDTLDSLMSLAYTAESEST